MRRGLKNQALGVLETDRAYWGGYVFNASTGEDSSPVLRGSRGKEWKLGP